MDQTVGSSFHKPTRNSVMDQLEMSVDEESSPVLNIHQSQQTDLPNQSESVAVASTPNAIEETPAMDRINIDDYLAEIRPANADLPKEPPTTLPLKNV